MSYFQRMFYGIVRDKSTSPQDKATVTHFRQEMLEEVKGYTERKKHPLDVFSPHSKEQYLKSICLPQRTIIPVCEFVYTNQPK